MNALLWKDYRMNRLVLLAGMVLLLAPPVVVIAVNVYSAWKYEEPLWPWPAALHWAAVLSLLFSFITVAMLGGMAFACERADRSAEFLAYLPPTRVQIVVSKVILVMAGIATIWAANLLLLYVLAPRCGELHPQVADDLRELREQMLPPLAATTVCLLGAAWFGSSFLPSHGIATGLACGFPVLLFGVLRTIAFVLEEYDLAEHWYPPTAIVLGVAGFVGGIWIYLRRVEP
jgi:hypothetical protein